MANNDTGKEMSFLEHLEELRWHIVRSLVSVVVFAIVVFFLKDFIFDTVIFGPKHESFPTYHFFCHMAELIHVPSICFKPPDFDFVTPVFGELFITHIKVSIVLGIVASFPYIFWEFWTFFKPGLYEKERKVTKGIVTICSTLFLMGILFGYFVISPFAIKFLAGYQIQGVAATPSLASFVNYMVMFTLPAGMIFELPIVVYFLSKIGLVTPEIMRKYRRHSIVLILILAAIITPPDVVTQFLIGIPLYILYEASIFVSARVIKNMED